MMTSSVAVVRITRRLPLSNRIQRRVHARSSFSIRKVSGKTTIAINLASYFAVCGPAYVNGSRCARFQYHALVFGKRQGVAARDSQHRCL